MLMPESNKGTIKIKAKSFLETCCPGLNAADDNAISIIVRNITATIIKLLFVIKHDSRD